MGLSDNAVVVLVIIGAGFTLLVTGAIAKFFVRDRSTALDPFRDRPIEQSIYMRRLRQRNLAWAWREAKGGDDRYLSPDRASLGQRSGSTWTQQQMPIPEGRQEQQYYYYSTSDQTTPKG